MEIVSRKNFFVDTSRSLQMLHCKGDKVQLNMNPAGIHCGDGERIRLILKQFSMYKSWSNINTTNSLFRIETPGSTGEQTLELTKKNYSSINTIVQEFANRVNEALIVYGHYASGTITINNPTGNDIDDETDNILSFTITTNTAHGLSGTDSTTGIDLRCYVEDGDSFIILGGNRITPDVSYTNSFNITYPTATTILIKGLYPAQATSQAYIYLRTDIQNDALETAALSSKNTDTVGTINQSHILAKIPIDRTYLTFDSQTDEYFINLDVRNLTHMELRLCDSHDRDLPQIIGQSSYGNLNFNCVIEIQVIRDLSLLANKLNAPREIDYSQKPSGVLTSLKMDTRVKGFNK